MSEITKLYENAGIKKINTHQSEINNGDPRFTGISHSDSYIKYPPFTAKKQIAILQLLTQRCDLTISHFSEWEFIHFDGQEPIQITGKDFAETFAKLINAYWLSLTEEECKQIKEILE